MVFELFSSGSNKILSYPDFNDPMIPFLFRNGTESTSNSEMYNVFGRNDAQGCPSLKDFMRIMHNITFCLWTTGAPHLKVEMLVYFALRTAARPCRAVAVRIQSTGRTKAV